MQFARTGAPTGLHDGLTDKPFQLLQQLILHRASYWEAYPVNSDFAGWKNALSGLKQLNHLLNWHA